MPILLFPPGDMHSLLRYSQGPVSNVNVPGISTKTMPQTLTMAKKILTRPAIVRRTK